MPSSARNELAPNRDASASGLLSGVLHVEAPLDDVLRVEVGARGVVAGLVDGELHAQLADGGHVPVLALVLVTDLGRRVRQAGLVEEVLVEVQVRRVGRERDADRGAALAELEEVDELGVDAVDLVAGLVDERLQVEELVTEEVQALDADRPDEVRRVARGDLGLEDVRRDVVVVDLEGDVDVLLRLVVGVDELRLFLELLRLTARAQSDEPADDDAAVGTRGGRIDRRGGDRRRGGRRCDCRLRCGWRRCWRGPVEAAPPQAPRTSMNPTNRTTTRDVPRWANLRFSSMSYDSSNCMSPDPGQPTLHFLSIPAAPPRSTADARAAWRESPSAARSRDRPTCSTRRRTISRPISSIGCRTLVEGRIQRLGDGRVVEPDNGDVVRDAPAGSAQRLEGAGGHRVRGGEDRVDVGSRGEEFVAWLQNRPAA